MTEARDLAALAARLKRPTRLWPALAHLEPENLGFLHDAIDDACRHRREHVEARIAKGLFPPLGALVLRIVRAPR
jgi:hypothetical protein